jgi:acyl carrier protein
MVREEIVRPDIAAAVRMLVASIAEVDETQLRESSQLFGDEGLGLDSLDRLVLSLAIAEDLKIDIAELQFEESWTLQDLTDFLSAIVDPGSR